MEDIIKALNTNFDLLDFFYENYKNTINKEDNFFSDAKYIEKDNSIDIESVKLNPDKYHWSELCYNHNTPGIENLINSHYKKIDWFKLSKNPKLVWHENLFNKYWDKILVNSIISNSQMFWDEKLVRFIISKHIKESTKIFWLEKFSVIPNIKWNLKMILDFPTSYWIRDVIKNNTLEIDFDKLIESKELLKAEVFKYLQVSDNLIWELETIQEFKDLIDFNVLSKSKNVAWSNAIISTFESKLDFKELSKNQSISLDENIIKKFDTRWDFECLSSNPGVKWNINIIDLYIDKIDLNRLLSFNIAGINDQFIDKYSDYINWGTGCNNYTYTPAKISRYNHIPISVHTLSSKATSWESGCNIRPYWSEKINETGEWHSFSSNHFLTSLHLETFADQLSWDIISSNEHLSITKETLLKFVDKWNWQIILNRSDFNLEHFLTIHNYFNFETLKAHSLKVFELFESEKNIIFSHIRDNVEIVGDFRLSLRKPNYGYDDEYDEGIKLIKKKKREFLVKQSERANHEFEEIVKFDDRYDLEDQESVYYNKIHYWLRKYFKIFDQISSLSDTLERERKNTPEREIQIFFGSYCQIEKDFKENYFRVFQK
jgi:hypothetical protein